MLGDMFSLLFSSLSQSQNNSDPGEWITKIQNGLAQLRRIDSLFLLQHSKIVSDQSQPDLSVLYVVSFLRTSVLA